MDKRFLGIIAAILIIFVGVVAFTGNKTPSTGNAQPTNHTTGKTTSSVTLVEYGDYECPACESFQPVVNQITAKYSDRVKFQFRNLPLSSIHPNAFAGARAAEAADKQGKFWQMHEALYQNSNWSQWSTSKDPNPFFEQYAQQLGLNVTTFKADFASSAVNDSINADIAAFKKTGQQEATPTYFLNGTYISNSNLLDASNQPSFDAFAKLLDAELAKKATN
ncbi:MAG: thioredoxin domain-containing protein [Candidatus Saccharimonadales bacterium]